MDLQIDAQTNGVTEFSPFDRKAFPIGTAAQKKRGREERKWTGGLVVLVGKLRI